MSESRDAAPNLETVVETEPYLADSQAPSGEPAAAEVRHLPALAPVAEARPVRRSGWASLASPVAAAGGVVAGMVAFVIVRAIRHRASSVVGRWLARGGRRRAKALEVAGTRSFLIDVHLLRR